MNPAICQQAVDGIAGGVGASLRAVDCAAGEMAQAAFGRLFGTNGALLPALTILLTLYIAFFAFSLITGRSRIGMSALTPRMITLGLVLTFATSWVAYQGVVWNLATGAPDQIAGVLMGSEGSATNVFADKIDLVMTALERASGNGTAPSSTFSPLGLMWLGGILLLLGTVGVLAVCKIALAVLLALGPVFVVLALFGGTRGLFTGWLKGMVMLAIAPLFAVLGGSLMLELAIPILNALAPTLPGQIEPRAAMAFFMIGAVHAALMVMVLKVAGTMVAGWSVFGLAASAKAEQAPAAAPALAGRSASTPASSPSMSRGEAMRTASLAPSRAIGAAGSPPVAANDGGSAASIARTTTYVPAAAAGGSANAALSRTRGIGSRFRPAASARLVRSPEKSQ